MAYIKWGPDSVGRIVEQPTRDGNLVLLPNRWARESPRRERKAKARVIEFRTKFKELPGQKGPGPSR
jgi:hypothetical protein